jgi:hypothetical protein
MQTKTATVRSSFKVENAKAGAVSNHARLGRVGGQPWDPLE